MSTQEDYLKAIADAIREKDGSTEPIPAKDFSARILDIPTGGGDAGYAIPLVVTADSGTTVMATLEDTVLASVASESGIAKIILDLLRN